jgi:hypothetical protein
VKQERHKFVAIYRNPSGSTEENHKIKMIPDLQTRYHAYKEETTSQP